ncbi:Leucine-rich repeat protein kinase family protein [Raphanus sativus]|nr:Leucine-rich repeat protein kinase family protein [Raphanus sativus]
MGAKRLDFSNNNLSGSLPGYIANFSFLEYLNLSINNFKGKVPTEGKFQNANVVTVFGNKDLCGGIKELKLKPCIVQAQPMETTSHFSHLKKVSIGVSVGTGKRPTDELFEGNVTLRSYTKLKVLEIADNSILNSGPRVGFPLDKCLTLVLELGFWVL